MFLPDKPTAVIAASLTPPVRLVGLADPIGLDAPSSVFARQLTEELNAPATQPYILRTGPLPMAEQQILRRYGLVQTDRCQKISLALLSAQLCSLDRNAPTP